LRGVGCDAETSMSLEAGLCSELSAVRIASANALREFCIGRQDAALASRCLGGLLQADSQLMTMAAAPMDTKQIVHTE